MAVNIKFFLRSLIPFFFGCKLLVEPLRLRAVDAVIGRAVGIGPWTLFYRERARLQLFRQHGRRLYAALHADVVFFTAFETEADIVAGIAKNDNQVITKFQRLAKRML